MNEITKELLRHVSDYQDGYEGAYNIRENGCCVGRKSTEHIRIESKDGRLRPGNSHPPRHQRGNAFPFRPA